MATDFKLFDLTSAACRNPKMLFGHGFFRARGRKEFEHAAGRLNQSIRQARRFVLDDEFTEVIAHLSHSEPKYLVEALRRARLPFPIMWVEWNQRVFARANHADGYTAPLDETVPNHVGMLLEERPGSETTFSITVVSDSPETNSIVMFPFGFVYDSEEPVVLHMNDHERRVTAMIESYEQDNRVYALGGVYVNRHREQADYLADLARSVGYRSSAVHRALVDGLLDSPRGDRDKHVIEVVGEIAGDYRILLAVLGMLNTVTTLTENIPSAGFGVRRGQRIRYLDYHRLTLKLPKEKVIARQHLLFKPQPRRAHEVMGHWVTRRGKRYWRRPHVRGDASLGFVQKPEYVLTNR